MSFIAASIIGGGALIGGAGSLFSGILQSDAEKQAAQTILQGQQQAIGAETGYVNQGTSAIQSLLAPFISAGTSAGNSILGLLNGTQSLPQTLAGPLKFLQQTGMWGVNNAASTTGLGGNVVANASQYNQGLASTQWGNLIQPLLQLFQGGAGAAQSGASGIGSLLGSAGQTVSNIFTGASQNVAQTQVGGASALGAGITGAASSFSPTNMLATLLGSKLLGGLGGATGMNSAQGPNLGQVSSSGSGIVGVGPFG